MPSLLMTQPEVEALAIKVGFWPSSAKTVAAIAMCEAPAMKDGVAHSDFGAVGDQSLATDKWGYSYGGMQIRSLRADKGTGRTRDELRLVEPAFNLRSAQRIKLDAGSFRPWTTFTNKMYQAYLQETYPPPPNTYVVVGGDTLSTIAFKLGNKFTWTELAAANGITAPYTIHIGDLLLLPWTGAGV